MVVASEAGNVPGMEARGLLGFVGVFVLFVQDDHAQIGEGGKDGRPCADAQGDLTCADLTPCVESFALGEGGVEHRHFFAVVGAEDRHRLGGQGNFGDQEDHLLSLFQYTVDGGFDDHGLAAACDTVEQDGTGLTAVQILADDLQRRRLLVGELHCVGGSGLFGLIGQAMDLLARYRDQLAIGEGFDLGGGDF